MKPAKEWVKELPPDVLEHPMPFPARLDYAEAVVRRIQSDARADLVMALSTILKRGHRIEVSDYESALDALNGES